LPEAEASSRPALSIRLALFNTSEQRMSIVLTVMCVAGVIPIGEAIRAHRQTSLLHALGWTFAAWLMWGAALLQAYSEDTDLAPSRYYALCLTGCAGIAVLGARRPHVFAWNFVVLCLFAVMMWPMVEEQLLGTRTFGGLRIAFVAGTLAGGVVNYLPTRLAPAAFLLLLAGAGEIVHFFASDWMPGGVIVFDLLLMSVPWLAWSCVRKRMATESEFDRLWLDFRDNWGLVWGQRVREQFNHAAENAGWQVQLKWRGVRRSASSAPEEKVIELLRKLLQRFLPANQTVNQTDQRG
jgi:hypothetical protein